MSSKNSRPATSGTSPKLPPMNSADEKVLWTYIKYGIAFTVTFFPTMYFLVPIPMPKLPTVVDRLIFTLRLQTFSCFTLIAGLLKVMGIRRTSTAMDPINGKGEDYLAVHLRYNSNTLEQLLLSAAGQMVLSTFLAEPQMKAVPILVAMFVVARAAFYLGYQASPPQRALGMSATWLPTMGVWVVVLYHMLYYSLTTTTA